MYITLALAEVGSVMWSHELEHRDTPRSDSLPKVTESVDGREGAGGGGGRSQPPESGAFFVRLYRITLKKAMDEEKVDTIKQAFKAGQIRQSKQRECFSEERITETGGGRAVCTD